MSDHFYTSEYNDRIEVSPRTANRIYLTVSNTESKDPVDSVQEGLGVASLSTAEIDRLITQLAQYTPTKWEIAPR